MDFFYKFKNINKDVFFLQKFISFEIRNFKILNDDFKLCTFNIHIPTILYDISVENTQLLCNLPQIFSVLIFNDQIINYIESPKKIYGQSIIDDDNLEYAISDPYLKIITWANNGNLEIIETEKADGKILMIRLFNYGSTQLILCVTKKTQLLLTYDNINNLALDQNSDPFIIAILLYLKNNWENISSEQIMSLFDQGYTLVGEFTDGKHIITGSNIVEWFGFFKNGEPLDMNLTISLLLSCNLNVVKYKKVFNQILGPEMIDLIFECPRYRTNEGSIFYCMNVETNETILIKVRSIQYIFKNIFLLNMLAGNHDLTTLKDQIIRTRNYFPINTTVLVTITIQLIQFFFWVLDNKYPLVIFNSNLINLPKNLPVGFSNCWNIFLLSNAKTDISISKGDFGTFNLEEYKENTKLYDSRSYLNPCIVIFFQGLEGSGKSTLAYSSIEKLNRMGASSICIDQDEFYGDQLACRILLFHKIMDLDGPKIIMILRNNIRHSQYMDYLNMCKKLPCVISFISPDNINPLSLMVSIGGVLNRSQNGNTYFINKVEYSIGRIIQMMKKEYNEFKIRHDAKLIKFHNYDKELDMGAKLIINDNYNIESYVRTNLSKLNALRININIISDQVVKHIYDIIDGKSNNIYVDKQANYIGLQIDLNDKFLLDNFIESIEYYNRSNSGSEMSTGIVNNQDTGDNSNNLMYDLDNNLSINVQFNGIIDYSQYDEPIDFIDNPIILIDDLTNNKYDEPDSKNINIIHINIPFYAEQVGDQYDELPQYDSITISNIQISNMNLDENLNVQNDQYDEPPDLNVGILYSVHVINSNSNSESANPIHVPYDTNISTGTDTVIKTETGNDATINDMTVIDTSNDTSNDMTIDMTIDMTMIDTSNETVINSLNEDLTINKIIEEYDEPLDEQVINILQLYKFKTL